MSNPSFVGVIDSGVGGLSVLARMVELLPEERFVFFGDSANAPYGEKSMEWVRARSVELSSQLVDEGAKALVIACNTATSAAAEVLRERFDTLPVVGIEPALKPAALAYQGGRILVMATPMTLSLEKFHHLEEAWSSGCEIESVACEGLAGRIEQGNLDAPDLCELLEKLVGAYRGKVDAVVLGCTHYPFIADAIRAVLGDVALYDGAEGTARQLKHRLDEQGLRAQPGHVGGVELRSSCHDAGEAELYRAFAQRAGLKL